jgi:hypothetical protein
MDTESWPVAAHINLDDHTRQGETPMTDSARGAGDATGERPDRESTTGPPRWVRVFGISAVVVVVLFVILRFTVFGGM